MQLTNNRPRECLRNDPGRDPAPAKSSSPSPIHYSPPDAARSYRSTASSFAAHLIETSCSPQARRVLRRQREARRPGGAAPTVHAVLDEVADLLRESQVPCSASSRRRSRARSAPHRRQVAIRVVATTHHRHPRAPRCGPVPPGSLRAASPLREKWRCRRCATASRSRHVIAASCRAWRRAERITLESLRPSRAPGFFRYDWASTSASSSKRLRAAVALTDTASSSSSTSLRKLSAPTPPEPRGVRGARYRTPARAPDQASPRATPATVGGRRSRDGQGADADPPRVRAPCNRAVRNPETTSTAQQALAPRLPGALEKPPSSRVPTSRTARQSMAGRAAFVDTPWRLCHRLRGNGSDGQDRVSRRKSSRRPCKTHSGHPGGKSNAPKTTLGHERKELLRCIISAASSSFGTATASRQPPASGALWRRIGHLAPRFVPPATAYPCRSSTERHDSMYRRCDTGERRARGRTSWAR